MFSEENGNVRIEHGLHQELRFEDNTASRRAMVAFYQDQVQAPLSAAAVLWSSRIWPGEHAVTIRSRRCFVLRVLATPVAGSGQCLHRRSVRPLGQRFLLLTAKPWPLIVPIPRSRWTRLCKVSHERRTQAITASLDGKLQRTGTGWRASYRWQPVNTVTPVAVYDNFGQSAYLNLLIRQPIHCGHLLPNGTEALVDVRNLLAQGYRPFLTRDGSTLYFAQDARSIQGGLSFSF